MAKFLNYTNKDGVNDFPFNYAKARTGGYPYITKDGSTPSTSKFWLNYTNRNGSVCNGNHFNYNRVQNVTALTYDKKKKRDFSDYDGWIYYEHDSSNTFLFYIEDGNMYRVDSGYVEDYDGDGYLYTITDAGIREYNNSEYGVDGGAEKIQFNKQGEILMAETEEEKDLLYDYIVNEVYRSCYGIDKDTWKEILVNPLVTPVRQVSDYYWTDEYNQLPSFTEIVKKNSTSSSYPDLDLSDVTDTEGGELVPKEDHVYYIGSTCYLYDGEKLRFASNYGYNIFVVIDIDENGHIIVTDKIKYYHEDRMNLYDDRYFGPESELHIGEYGYPGEVSACIAKGKAMEIYEESAPVCFSLMPVDIAGGTQGSVVRNEVTEDGYKALTYKRYTLYKVYNSDNIKLDIPVNLPITSDVVSGKIFKSAYDYGGFVFYSDGTGKWFLDSSEDENGNLTVRDTNYIDAQWSISDGELTGAVTGFGQTMEFSATFDGNFITLTLEGVGMSMKLENFDGEITFIQD